MSESSLLPTFMMNFVAESDRCDGKWTLIFTRSSSIAPQCVFLFDIYLTVAENELQQKTNKMVRVFHFSDSARISESNTDGWTAAIFYGANSSFAFLSDGSRAAISNFRFAFWNACGLDCDTSSRSSRIVSNYSWLPLVSRWHRRHFRSTTERTVTTCSIIVAKYGKFLTLSVVSARFHASAMRSSAESS